MLASSTRVISCDVVMGTSCWTWSLCSCPGHHSKGEEAEASRVTRALPCGSHSISLLRD